MSGIPRPKDCFLNNKEKYKIIKGKQVWRSLDGDRYYTWDSLHGEVEVFDSQGWHLGSADPISESMIKLPKRGRRLHV